MTSRPTTALPLPGEELGEGPIDCAPLGETLARAEAATDALRASYPVWTRAELDKAQAALDAARQDPGARGAHLEALHAAMHNIKGQGSSFGYPLVTRIGQSLCRLTAPERAATEASLEVVQLHLDALMLVLDQRIAGNGGEIGERLSRRLETLADKVIGE